MQEEEEEQGGNQIGRLILAAAALGLVLLFCVATLFVLRQPDAPLPTAVATAYVDITSQDRVRQAGAPTITPVPETPAAPQPGSPSAGDAYIPELGNSGYDVQHYTIQLALDPAQAGVEGATTIEALSVLHGLSQLSLDFVGFEITTVTVNGRVVDFRREAKKLIIDLHEWLPAGTPFTIVVAYRGNPVVEPSDYLLFVDHLGLHYPDSESIFTIAEPDGARYWFPANDHPRDKATFRFEVAVPEGLTAVANGRLLETRPAVLGSGRAANLFIWEHNFPMAPYLAMVSVGPYERLERTTADGLLLRDYIFPELRPEFEEATAITGEAIAWMSELFGPYPFDTYGHVTAEIPGGSMETQTMVLLSSGMIGRRTVIHELAHTWFGNWVSLENWNEMWRNEGFATYVTFMWENRGDPEALQLQIDGVAASVAANDKQYQLNNPPSQFLFDFNVYFQGAVVVHALRQEMGDEAFFNGLQRYFQRYGGGTASDADFQAVMEEAAGRSLASFFEEWFGSE